MCGADVVSVQQVLNWYRGFANGQVSWMRSEVAVCLHQTCISVINDKMMRANRCVSLKQLRAGTHPLTSQCLGCCPWMLSQSMQQMGVTTTVWPTEAQQNGYLTDKPPVLQSWMYGLFVMHHNTWMQYFKPQLKTEFMVLKNSACQHSSSSWELWAWGRYNVWDSHRLILVNCMLHGVTVMAVALQLVSQCLTEALHHQRPGLLTWYILLLHYTTNTLLDMWWWECVPHPQQSPDCGSLGCSRFWKTGGKKTM